MVLIVVLDKTNYTIGVAILDYKINLPKNAGIFRAEKIGYIDGGVHITEIKGDHPPMPMLANNRVYLVLV